MLGPSTHSSNNRITADGVERQARSFLIAFSSFLGHEVLHGLALMFLKLVPIY